MATQRMMFHRRIESPFGTLCVSACDDGITALDWQETQAADAHHLLDQAQDYLTRYFAGKAVALTLPFHLDGTEHHQTVLRAMADIPYGQTETYATLAEKTGSVARAVGGVCGSNPIPILIPCHRVLSAGRRIGHFSAPGGPLTKMKLLDLEGARYRG
ncbi:MAG: methylated-DNA--[protein]-cysteine S-methyltransferase [Alphaproteobacteria bacterium]